MAEINGNVVMLDPRRNQAAERKKLYEEMLLKEMPGTSRPNEPMHAVLEGELGESEMAEGRQAQNVRNHALIHYLATLANSNNTKDTFDFDFVESLLNNGADVNSTDKTGQTIFHEVARSWNIDVATFLIKNGANVNQQDQFGRSPLHVAAAVDYAEMVEFLLQNGADIDIRTHGEGQAPVHFAAKNDAINSLQMLLGYGADIDARDGKNRTPLQVSAEMNRSEAAKLLINEGAPAGVHDNLGNSALSLLIEKIPEVALKAMDQLRSTDTINRTEFYFLNYLEGTKLKKKKTPARTPLEIAVQNERFDIILHPVMQRLITVKWQMYGKWGAVLDLILNLLYTILWTAIAVTLPKHGRDLYLPIGENSWRLAIGIILIIFTIMEIQKQIINTLKTRRELKKWREWRAAELERDIQYCHPRWPQETQYLRSEIKAVRNLSLISGSDRWIYFDWVALVLILATIISHVTFFHYSTDVSKEVHHYILIPLLLILWFRIFKYARPFEGAGPFVVIIGSVMADIVKWGFLNSVIIIPFACAFWITFGAISLTPVEGYDNVGPLLYNIFSMMVVNDHGYESLEEANPIMARILCGSFIAIAAIITLNLLIALLSNTFERLYENAVANAVMQRARTILLLQKLLRKKQIKNYYNFINKKGSPEVIRNDLGRMPPTEHDEHATLERLGDDVKTIMKVLGERFGKRFGKGKKSDIDFVKADVIKVKRCQEELVTDVKNIKVMLQRLTEVMEPFMGNVNNNNNNNNNNYNNTNYHINNNAQNPSVPTPDDANPVLNKNSNGKAQRSGIKPDDSSDASETENSDTTVDILRYFGENSMKHQRKTKPLTPRHKNKKDAHGRSHERKETNQISPPSLQYPSPDYEEVAPVAYPQGSSQHPLGTKGNAHPQRLPSSAPNRAGFQPIDEEPDQMVGHGFPTNPHRSPCFNEKFGHRSSVYDNTSTEQQQYFEYRGFGAKPATKWNSPKARGLQNYGFQSAAAETRPFNRFPSTPERFSHNPRGFPNPRYDQYQGEPGSLAPSTSGESHVSFQGMPGYDSAANQLLHVPQAQLARSNSDSRHLPDSSLIQRPLRPRTPQPAGSRQPGLYASETTNQLPDPSYNGMNNRKVANDHHRMVFFKKPGMDDPRAEATQDARKTKTDEEDGSADRRQIMEKVSYFQEKMSDGVIGPLRSRSKTVPPTTNSNIN